MASLPANPVEAPPADGSPAHKPTKDKLTKDDSKGCVQSAKVPDPSVIAANLPSPPDAATAPAPVMNLSDPIPTPDGSATTAAKVTEVAPPSSGDPSAATNATPAVTVDPATTDAAPVTGKRATAGARGRNASASGGSDQAVVQSSAAGVGANLSSSLGGDTDGSDATAATAPTATDAAAPADHGQTRTTPLNVDAPISAPFAMPTTQHGAAGPASTPATPTADAPSEIQFAQVNHAPIVGGIHGQLLPDGGTMTIRLDPPELGALNVSVKMRDGVMSATFEASNDQAVRLLSHSLGELKASLESQGMNVESMHVRQVPQAQDARPGQQDAQRDQNSSGQDENARREQQRQQMLRRMWKRLSGGDPLDLVA